jgi:uncharacterized protein
MATRLRAHHLLCMLTFVGEGYTPAFIRNFEEIARRIATGEETIEIVDGPDDLCAPLLLESDCHCRSARIAMRDHQAGEAIGPLLERPIRAGEQLILSHEQLRALREAFAAGKIRQACNGCQWRPLCNAISCDRFKETRLVRLKEPDPTDSNSR